VFCYWSSEWIVAVLGTDPVLPSEKDLANKLETTQDIQGFISCVRKLFMQLSGKKKFSKKSRMCSSWFTVLQMRERETAPLENFVKQIRVAEICLSFFSRTLKYFTMLAKCVIYFPPCCKMSQFKFRVLWIKLVETFKLFPWISAVVCTAFDVWQGGHCQHKVTDKHCVKLVPLQLCYELTLRQLPT
jgi:hypothetical protein